MKVVVGFQLGRLAIGLPSSFDHLPVQRPFPRSISIVDEFGGLPKTGFRILTVMELCD